MNDQVVYVTLPLPPAVLSPNIASASLRGRFMKAAAAKRYRQLAKKAVEEEQVEDAPWQQIEVEPFFHYATKRKRDEDNAVASLKAAYDGIVDAGLVKDDDPKHMARKWPHFLLDPQNPRVVLKITRLK